MHPVPRGFEGLVSVIDFDLDDTYYLRLSVPTSDLSIHLDRNLLPSYYVESYSMHKALLMTQSGLPYFLSVDRLSLAMLILIRSRPESEFVRAPVGRQVHHCNTPLYSYRYRV